MEQCTTDGITDVLEDVVNKLRKLDYDDNELDPIIKKLEDTVKNWGKLNNNYSRYITSNK